MFSLGDYPECLPELLLMVWLLIEMLIDLIVLNPCVFVVAVVVAAMNF